jgi:hypothetical protein
MQKTNRKKVDLMRKGKTEKRIEADKELQKKEERKRQTEVEERREKMITREKK